jgi:uncharacterized protein
MSCETIYGLTNDRRRQMKKIYFVLLFLLPTIIFAQVKVPELWGVRIHDEGKILSPGFIAQLEHQLKLYEDTTSNQIAILTIRSLEGEVLEEFSYRVAKDKWKLGSANNDNGVLLLIVVDDRKVRIEVGDGLEGALPDITCNQIIRNELAPQFRQGNYEGGVQAAIDGIIKGIGGEYHQEAPQVSRRGRSGGSFLTTIIIIFVIIIIQAIRNRGNRGGRGGRGRGWSSGTGWFGPTIGGGFGGGFGGGGGWSGGGGFSGGGGGFSGGGSSGSW